MKFSDAAVKGREILEPKQGNDLFEPEEGCTQYAGCYRGMAVVGAGLVKLPTDGWIDEEGEGYDLTGNIKAKWPWVVNVRVHKLPCACTCTGKTYEDFLVHQALAHLWDKHCPPNEVLGDVPHTEAVDDPWTFERITEWVRSIEPQDQPATTPQV